MSELQTMYSGKSNSPQTVTTAEISASAQSIPVESLAAFPDAPNLATLGTGDDAEVVLYNSKGASSLEGCIRGFGGTTAKIWPSDTLAYRAFTLYDYSTLVANIQSLFDSKLGKTGDAGDLVAEFTAAAQRANLVSGETLETLLGKLAKWYVDLSALAWSGQYSDLSGVPGTFSPSAHASTHGSGGSDAIAPSAIGAQPTITAVGILKGTGSAVSTAVSGTDYQAPIAVTGMLKGSGAGSVTQAQAGVDYQSPLSAGTDYQTPIAAVGLLKGAGSGSVSAAVSGTDYQAPVTATGILKGSGSGNVGAAVAGTDYARPMSEATATLTPSGWSGDPLQQTVSVSGVTASSKVLVTLAPDYIASSAVYGIFCVSQGSGQLTFQCTTQPENNVVMNIGILD